MAGLVARALREEGHAADVAARWRGCALDGAGRPLRRDRSRHHAPGSRRARVLRRLREAECWTPVLMLTARDAVDDRVGGLDAGADDYLTKPFSFEELLARLRALARRGPVERPTDRRGRRPPARSGGASRVARRRRARALGEGVRAARAAHAAARGTCYPRAAARGRVGHGVREPLERRRRLHPLPAREDRPSVRRRDDRDCARGRLPAARRTA